MRDSLLRAWSVFSAVLFTALIGGVLCYLLYNALPQLSPELVFGRTPPLDALFANAPVWEGLWPAIAGTGFLLLAAMAFVLPFGIATALYLAEYASARVCRKAIALLELFTGVPSIVMGLFGFLLILLLRHSVMPQAGTGLLLAAFCLSLLVLPVFVLTLHGALCGIPRHIRVTAAAIGLTHDTAVWHVFLPQAGKGLVSAFFLAAGRCAEDTAVILLTGAIANAGRAPSLTDTFEALPFYIYYTTANYQTEAEFMRVFAAVFFLLLLACLLLAAGHFFHRMAFKEW